MATTDYLSKRSSILFIWQHSSRDGYWLMHTCEGETRRDGTGIDKQFRNPNMSLIWILSLALNV